MALSNTERVGRVMAALKDGLGPFILREYRQVYKNRTVDIIDSTLSTGSYGGLPPEARASEAAPLKALATQGCLKV